MDKNQIFDPNMRWNEGNKILNLRKTKTHHKWNQSQAFKHKKCSIFTKILGGWTVTQDGKSDFGTLIHERKEGDCLPIVRS